MQDTPAANRLSAPVVTVHAPALVFVSQVSYFTLLHLDSQLAPGHLEACGRVLFFPAYQLGSGLRLQNLTEKLFSDCFVLERCCFILICHLGFPPPSTTFDEWFFYCHIIVVQGGIYSNINIYTYILIRFTLSTLLAPLPDE
jgi:hypothetical protein